jgi:hypothetical protein
MMVAVASNRAALASRRPLALVSGIGFSLIKKTKAFNVLILPR